MWPTRRAVWRIALLLQPFVLALALGLQFVRSGSEVAVFVALALVEYGAATFLVRLLGRPGILPVLAPLVLAACPPGYVFGALAFVAWMLPVALRTRGARAQALSHAQSDRDVVLAALWIAIPHWMLLTAWRCVHRTEDWPLVVWFDIPFFVLAPIILALVARSRFELRREWLERVRTGREPKWELRHREAAGTIGLPLLDGQDGERVRVLANVHEPTEPFRDAQIQPVALVGRGLSQRD
jgi:hypothetical protein